MKIFIDTNIYLNYFRRSEVSLSSLKELKKLIGRKKLKLVLPVQTRDEYLRNRNGIAERSRDLIVRETDLKLMFPAPFVKGWPEAARVQKRVEATRKAYRELLKKYDTTVSMERTPADVLIQQLFKSAEVLEDSEDVLRRSYFRYLRGHPPRKTDGSMGDAISWELLLVKAKDDLVIITGDGDFAEKRRGDTYLNGFLEKEWRAKCDGKTIKLYNSLGEFINAFERRETVKNDVVKKEKELIQSATISYGSGIPLTLRNVGTFLTPNNMSFVVNNAPYLSQPPDFMFVGGKATPIFPHPGQVTVGNSLLQDPFLGTQEKSFLVGTGIASTMTDKHVDPGVDKQCQACKGDVSGEFLAFSASVSSHTNKFKCPHCGSEIEG